MDDAEKYIKLIDIASTEYMDKHHHYWSIYWKFLTGLAFVMSLYVFGEKNIASYIQANRMATAAVFILLILMIGAASFLVMCREHRVLSLIGERRKRLYEKIKEEPFPGDGLSSLSPLERLFCNKVHIATVLSTSILVISLLCIGLIVLSSFIGVADTPSV